MYNNREIRAEAWTLTKANLGKLFGLMLAVMVVPVTLVVAAILPAVLMDNSDAPVVGILLAYIIIMVMMPPLTTGGARMFLNLHRSGELRVADCVYYLTSIKRFGKTILLMLIIGVITFVLAFIPIAGMVVLVWIQFRVAIATWLLAGDDRLTAVECIKFSFELMKGHCWRYFCMTFVLGLVWTGLVFACMMPIMIIGVAFESAIMVMLAMPIMLVVYALFMPYYVLAVTGFAAELMPAAPAAPVNNSPELL